MAFRFNPRPFRWLVLAGIAAVLGATLASFRTRTRERAEPRPAPPLLSSQVNQQTQAFSLSKTLGDHTLYTIEAKEVTHFQNRVVLRDVAILLYGKQGERRDRIETQECEFDPATGTLTISGEVTMHLGIPAAEPNREQGTGTREQKKEETSGRGADSDLSVAYGRELGSSGPLPHGRGSDSEPPLPHGPFGFAQGRRGSDMRRSDSVSIVTTGLSFDQNTGIASTDQKVRFWFARGQGSAKGADYDPQTQQLVLRSAVEFALRDVAIQPPRTPSPEFPQEARSLVREERSASMGENNEALTHVRAGSLRFQQGESVIYLGGPVELIRDTRRLQAGESEILLDERRQARRILLEGGVIGVDQSPDRAAEVRAQRGVLDLSAQGKLRNLQLEEDVNWTSSMGELKREGSAERAELFYTEPAGLLERIVAIQDARMVLRDAPGPTSSATASASATAGRRTLSQGPVLGAGTQTLAGQRIEMTLAPDGETLRHVATRSRSTLELVPYSPSEDPWRVEGEEFDMGFDPAGNLTHFAAERTVRLIADSPNRPPARRISTSDHLTATLDPRARSIARIEQWGRYQYQDPEKQARAERADYSGEREVIVLRGESVVWNATGKLSANRIALDNRTGNVEAEGKVSTTYLPTPRSETSDSLPIHAVAERLRYEAAAGKAEYEGHVRLWQGSSLVEAGWVELDRRQRQLEARGKVYSVFTQLPVKHAQGSAESRSARAGETEPTEIRSEGLLYKEDARRATYRGAVRMRSAAATVHSGELELLFAPVAGGATVTESGRIEQAVASRAVVILDSGRKATADRAEYFPEEARVLLFGKPATVADPQRGNTQGVRLTYRMGDDRIFVEGEPGLPAETRRQVHR